MPNIGSHINLVCLFISCLISWQREIGQTDWSLYVYFNFVQVFFKKKTETWKTITHSFFLQPFHRLPKKSTDLVDCISQAQPLNGRCFGECAQQSGRHSGVKHYENSLVISMPHQPSECLLYS